MKNHRIDHQHDDDNVEVHFKTGRLLPDSECLHASAPLQLVEPESVAELRVPELPRKQFRTTILAVDD